MDREDDPAHEAMVEAMAFRVRLKASQLGVDLHGQQLLEVAEAVMLKPGALLDRVRMELARRGML